MFKLDLEKTEEPEIKLATSVGSSKKQASSRKTSAAAAKLLQSHPTLCDPRQQPTRLPNPWDSPGKNTRADCHFLLQCMKVKSESEVAQLCPTLATPWTAAYQAPPPMGFSRQEYWSGVPRDSANGIKVRIFEMGQLSWIIQVGPMYSRGSF